LLLDKRPLKVIIKQKGGEMKRFLLLVAVLMLLGTRGYCEVVKQEAKEFGGIVTETVSMTALVEAVDYKTREVTLKNEEGQVKTIVAGPEVKNFAQIVKGDKVNIEYSESIKIIVSPESTLDPIRQEATELATAPLGQKPAGVVTAVTQITAIVQDIDYLKRTVVLKGPERTVTVQVGDSASNLYDIKPGDTVYLEFVEQLAIAVTK
jgi:Cu/Ag efflux protein CusF